MLALKKQRFFWYWQLSMLLRGVGMATAGARRQLQHVVWHNLPVKTDKGTGRVSLTVRSEGIPLSQLLQPPPCSCLATDAFVKKQHFDAMLVIPTPYSIQCFNFTAGWLLSIYMKPKRYVLEDILISWLFSCLDTKQVVPAFATTHSRLSLKLLMPLAIYCLTSSRWLSLATQSVCALH